MIMTLIITGCLVPLMLVYSNHDALVDLPNYGWNQYTLGNIGGADTFCAQSTFQSPEMAIPIKCSSGLIDLDAVS